MEYGPGRRQLYVSFRTLASLFLLNIIEPSALKGLYPGIDAAGGGGDIKKNDKCIISDCDVSSCGNGFKCVSFCVHSRSYPLLDVQ